MSSLPGCLTSFVRFCAGSYLGLLIALFLWRTLAPSGSSPAIFNFGLPLGAIICGLLTLTPPATSLFDQTLGGEEPDVKLNTVCFLAPLIFGPLLMVLFVNVEGFLGLPLCFFLLVVAAGALFGKPSRRIKQAAWSTILGFVASVCFSVGRFYYLSGAPLPWSS